MPTAVSRKFPFAMMFDMDGVIVDSNPYHKTALREFCSRHGYELSEEDLRNRIYGRTNRGWITNLFGDISESLLESYAKEKEALYRKLYQEDIQPVKGLREFLSQLKQLEIPCGIGTSAPRENVDFTLGLTGLSSYFPVILDDSFVTNGKPNPEIYLKTASALGYPADRCFVLEDSLSGVEAGLAAGSLVIAITTTHSREELDHAHHVIGDFTEIDTQKLHELMQLHGRHS